MHRSPPSPRRTRGTARTRRPVAVVVLLAAGVSASPQLDLCTYDVGVTGARDIAAYYRDAWHPVG
jgi:hypothetical protein